MPDKEQYVSEVREKMSDWDRRIEEIIEKTERSDKDSVLVEDLLEKQKEAKSRFEELEGADEARFEDVKGRVSVATQALQDVLVRTSEQFQLGNPRPPSGSTRAGERGVEAAEGQGKTGEQFGAGVRGEQGSPVPAPGSSPAQSHETPGTTNAGTPPQSGATGTEGSQREDRAGTERPGEARPGEAQKRRSME